MFDDLDSTLQAILNDASAPLTLRSADVSFETPDRDFAPDQATVNLFLVDVREHRELRDPVPIIERNGDVYNRRLPPLRVQCTYLVTTWSDQADALRIAEEHRLLALALAWFSRFGVIPGSFLQGTLAGQPFPPPSLIAQTDGQLSSSEFWSALGIAPRPSFTVVVTIALDLNQVIEEGPAVITSEMRLQLKRGDTEEAIAIPGTRTTTFQIGGTVLQAGTDNPIAGALVRLVEYGVTVATGTDGRFQFIGLEAGNYNLEVTAGAVVTTQAVTVPGASDDAYDVEV
ncbi:MAG: Pvc16 family protein [Phototrophicaceae bacterium]